MDLLLHDQAHPILMDELHRVLHRDDLAPALAIDHVQQAVERGRLAGAGRAGDQDQPAALLHQLLHDGWQAQLLRRPQRQRADPDRGFHVALVVVDAHPEVSHLRKEQGDAELPVPLELLALPLGEGAVDQLPDRVAAQRRGRAGDQLPVDPEHGRQPHRQVDIRRVLPQRLPQDLRQPGAVPRLWRQVKPGHPPIAGRVHRGIHADPVHAVHPLFKAAPATDAAPAAGRPPRPVHQSPTREA